MKKMIAVGFAIAVSLIMTAALAQPDSASNTFSPQQQKSIEKIIHNYLVKNPQVLVEASQALQAQMQAKKEISAVNAIKTNKQQLFRDSSSPMAGNPKGSVILVEFLDYQCGHCKALYKVIDKLIKIDSNLKVIFKDFPIFGANSEYAAKASLAAYKLDPEKYMHLHDGLLAANDPLANDRVDAIIKASGYDVAALKAEMAKPAITNQLKANLQLAKKLGLQGTPALVVANKELTQFKFSPGAAPEETIQAMIKAVSTQ